MMKSQAQTVRTLAMAAGLAAGHTAVAFATGEPVAEVSSQTQAQQAALKASFDQVTRLISLSEVVKAKDLLGSLRANSGVSMSVADSARYQELYLAAVAREKTLDRNELSVQKAQQALDSGELKLAEQHAKAVASATGVSPVLQKRADSILGTVDVKRRDAVLAAPAAIRAAANAYDMGKYQDAKNILDAVIKSGVDLPVAESKMLDEYRDRIVALAQTNSELFGRPSAGMLQPGEIQPRRPEEPAATPAPAAAPVETALAQPAAQPEQPPSDAMIAARRNEASRELARANGLFEEKKYAEAISAYQNTRTTYGDVLTAEQSSQLAGNLAASQQAMAAAATASPAPSGAAQPGGALSSFQQNTTIAKQQALAEFNNDLMQAAKSLEQSNIEEARQLAARADLKLASRRMLFSEPERNELATRVATLRADIEKKGDELAAAERIARDNKLAVDAAEGARSESALRSAKIREHIDRVRSLQRERKYDEALQVCEQILFLDPQNPTGNLLRDVLRDMRNYSELASIDAEKTRSYSTMALDNSRSLISPTSIVTYPKDWPNISNIRSEALAFQDTVDNRRVIAALDNTRIPKAELADTPFEAALKYLQTFANVNMDIDWASLEAIGVQKDTTISLNLTNPTVKTVLEQVLNKAAPSLDLNSRASWTVYDGVLHIGSEPALRKNKVMVIYDVQDLLFEVRDKVDVPELDLQASFRNTGGGRGGGGGQSPFGQGNQNRRQPGQGLQRPIEDRIRDLRNIIVEQVDKDGWEDGGGDTGTIQVFQQNLIVTNTPKNHRAIEGLLSQLRRVRNMQINVEARFLVVASDFFEKIGFDVDLYLNARGNQTRFLRGFNYAFMPSEFFPDGRYSGNNVNSGNKVVDTDNDGVPDGALAGGGPAAPPPENFSVIGIANSSLGLASRLMTSPFASEVTGSGTAAPALGISGTFLDDVQVDFLLEATQADRRAVSLNAPRLTFTNGQTANVYVARQIAYISDLEPVIANQSVAFDPIPGFVNDGVTLLVSGVILADRRYVQLDVETRVSNYPEDRIRRIPVSAGAAGGGAVGGGGGGANASITGLIELPQGQIQSVSTTVTVPDQGTVLLGGQRLTNEVEVESGVPVLGKIPILNRFFSNRSMSREERTLLMLIRPQILIQDETEDRFFPGLRDAIRTGGFGS